MKMMNYYNNQIIIYIFNPFPIFLFFFSVIFIPGQQNSNFKGICRKTSPETSYFDIAKAVKLTDSLYVSSKDPAVQGKFFMLSANICQQTDDFKKPGYYTENATVYRDKAIDEYAKTVVSVFSAQHYRIVGLHETLKKYFSEDFKTVGKRNSHEYHNNFGLLNLEMNHYKINIDSYGKSIHIENSLHSFVKTIENKIYFLISSAYQLLGKSYFKLNGFKVSEQQYRRAEVLLREPNYLLSFMYSGLHAVKMKYEQWKNTDSYLKNIENIADKSSYFELQKHVSADISDYDEGVGNAQQAGLNTRTYVKAFSQGYDNQGILMQNKQNINILERNNSSDNNRIGVIKNIIIIVLIACLIWMLIYFTSKQKRSHNKFKHIIKNQQKKLIDEKNDAEIPVETEPDFSSVSVEEIQENDDVGKKRNESLMTLETEAKLLELLEDFEKGELFNSNNMSLPFLAGELNTNTKYLSYVINQHKSTDFKSYINRLRINYIVDKLNNDEKYRQYKISTLADECGFSSHSKFASVFKAVTNFSPSAYIKLLNADNQKDNISHFPENEQ